MPTSMSLYSSPPTAREKRVFFNDSDQPVLPKIESDDEGEDWMDVPSPTTASFSASRITSTLGPPSSNAGYVSPRQTRKRKVNGVYQRTTFVAVPSLNGSPRKQPRARAQTPTIEDVSNLLLSGSSFTYRYIINILGYSLSFLKRPFAFFLALYILALLVARLKDLLFVSLVKPFCFIPPLSYTSVCAPLYPSSASSGGTKQQQPKWADYPSLISVQSPTFEALLDSSAGGSLLATEIKKAETATNDLATLVKYSDLISKDTLAQLLKQFVDDARRTGKSLQKLNSKIGGTVDNIMAVNDYALNAITMAQANKPSVIDGVVKALVPWTAPSQNPEVVILETFTTSMDVLSESLAKLILLFESTLKNLDDLEERLNTIHEVIAREDSHVRLAREEVLAQLWTILGMNGRKIRRFENNLHLLKGVDDYRKRALAHVVGALQTLQSMSEDVEELRERVAAPDILGVAPSGAKGIPMEVHVRSIKSGLERLQDGRLRARLKEDDVVKAMLGINDEEDEPGTSRGIERKVPIRRQ